MGCDCYRVYNQNLDAIRVALQAIDAQYTQLYHLFTRGFKAMGLTIEDIFTQVDAQGAELDKVEAEIQKGNATLVTAEQLQTLKGKLDVQKATLDRIDALHPDTDTQAPANDTVAGEAGQDAQKAE